MCTCIINTKSDNATPSIKVSREKYYEIYMRGMCLSVLFKYRDTFSRELLK